MNHPAKFSKTVLQAIHNVLGDDVVTVLDPFAGVGGVHALAERRSTLVTYGVELEQEWADAHPRTTQGNALRLPYEDETFDAIVTSPCYGNRMADQYVPPESDDSRRYTYRLALGRPLSDDSGAGLQWGPGYRDFHARAWKEAVRVLRPGGEFVLNISDHVRGGRVQAVSAWHIFNLTFEHGLALRLVVNVDTPRLLDSPHRARAGSEFVVVLDKL